MLYSGGSAQASFSHMRTGGYATFDGPYVCLSDHATEDQTTVRLTGIELYPPDSGIEVTDFGVTRVGEPGPTPVTAKRRLRDLPQAASLVADAAVTGACHEHPSAVWLELRKTRDGDLGVVKTRYVYVVGDQTARTPWFTKGYALTE